MGKKTVMPDQWTNKQAGVVYTPSCIVRFMLDDLLPQTLGNIRVCEPACGGGAFLTECARRICLQMQQADDPAPYLHSLRHLTGFDISQNAVDACKANLASVARETLGDDAPAIPWRVYRIDLLNKQSWSRHSGQFQYVVGNPPYIRVQHLERSRRRVIAKGEWQLMSGCADMYYLFYEAGLKLLVDGGSLSFITPSTWMKTMAGQVLREHLKQHRVGRIIDFGYEQVFPGVSTYTAITRVHKEGSSSTDTIPATRASIARGKVKTGTRCTIDTTARMWWLASRQDRARLTGLRENGVSLGRIADINVGIQTLSDSVFILDAYDGDDDLIWCRVDGGTIPVERASTRPIVKVSVMKHGADPLKRVAIYPYENGRLMSFDRFADRYPHAADWLTRNKARLLARDKGRTTEDRWHGYGRQVGITSAFGTKILTSGMNRMPNFMLCDQEDTLFYSGYAIKPRRRINIEQLLDELNSENMLDYIRTTSRPYQNGWYSYAKSFIHDFPVSRKILSA